MKTNEAPEKIYLQQNTTTDCYEEWWPEWFEARGKNTDIEYTRTDAFIEKACEWFSNMPLEDMTYKYDDFDSSEGWDKMIDDFKNYMKGE